jgi:hypothetical protein
LSVFFEKLKEKKKCFFWMRKDFVKKGLSKQYLLGSEGVGENRGGRVNGE